MFGKKHTKPQNRIDCLIGAGTVVKGDLTFDGGLRVDGQVHGTLAGMKKTIQHTRFFVVPVNYRWINRLLNHGFIGLNSIRFSEIKA